MSSYPFDSLDACVIHSTLSQGADQEEKSSGGTTEYAWLKIANFTMQALSIRIKYGKFIAEAKYRASLDDYEVTIRAHVRILLSLNLYLLEFIWLLLKHLISELRVG